ncbi:hypothetical protein F5Y10DRAFT_11591 [Nemania abortiva]|nr:hypothetical protein F5Y10DRAFT_11591 [Nemania abortiva]
MANFEPACSLRSSDAARWHEAVQLYNSKLKNGPSNKKYINTSTQGSSENNPKNHADELMATAIGSYQKLTKKRSPFAIALIRIYSSLRQYSRAIDVFIQCDPTIAALVWGSIRVLLQMGDEEEQASRTAGEGIMEIVRHAGRWEQVSAASDILNSSRIQKQLVALYVRVLDFLVSSTQWLRRGTLGKMPQPWWSFVVQEVWLTLIWL